MDGSLASAHLCNDPQARGWKAYVPQIERKDFFKVARAILTLRFWKSQLTTDPGYTWCACRLELQRVMCSCPLTEHRTISPSSAAPHPRNACKAVPQLRCTGLAFIDDVPLCLRAMTAQVHRAGGCHSRQGARGDGRAAGQGCPRGADVELLGRAGCSPAGRRTPQPSTAAAAPTMRV